MLAHAQGRTLCSCKMCVDPLSDHVLTCKQHRVSIRGHNHLMDVFAASIHKFSRLFSDGHAQDLSRLADFLFEQIELQAKLLNYFLGSNKSNINQSAGASAPIPRMLAHAQGRTLCSCKMCVDPLSDHVLTCKQHRGSIRGHNHLMDVFAASIHKFLLLP